MKVIRPADQPGPAGKPGSQFTGDVFPYVTMPSTDGVVINTVTFTPGARTHWHSHERGQILVVLAGLAHVQSDGSPLEVLHQGDVAWVPAGERHWHGAGPDAAMTHLAISLGTTAWEGPVELEPHDPETTHD